MQLSRLNLMVRDHPKALGALAGAFIVAAAFYQRKCSSAEQEREEEATGSAKSSVVVLGDVFVDLMVQSDSLPVWDSDTVTTTPISALAGGSGLNTATHLSASFQVPTSMWSAIGSGKNDAWSTLLRAHAARARFHLRGALDCAATGVCVVMTGKHDRAFITHRGPIGEMHLVETAPAPEANGHCQPSIDVHALLENLAPGGHLHIAGYYNCPRLWGAPMAMLLQRAKQLGCTTSLNSQFDATGEWGHMSELLPHLDVLLASRSEALAIAKGPLASSDHSDNDNCSNSSSSTSAIADDSSSGNNFSGAQNADGPAERAAKWFVDGGCGMAVVTLGRRGALAAFNTDPTEDESCGGKSSSPSPATSPLNTSARRHLLYQAARANVPVVDSTGAGDAFNAGFIAGWRDFLRSSDRSGGDGRSSSQSSRISGSSSPGSEFSSSEAAVQRGLWWGVAAGAACVGQFGASEPLLISTIEACAPVALS